MTELEITHIIKNTNMKESEGNKLIAEFMNLDMNNRAMKGLYDNNQLPYHSDWNWLMPVVEKIEGIDVPTSACVSCEKDGVRLITYPSVTKPRHYSRFVSVTFSNWIIADCGGDSKIEAVYNSVVEFIKWYNSQSK